MEGNEYRGQGFYSYYSLTSTTIPDSVRYIGPDVFACCGSRTAITVLRASFAAEYCQRNNLPYPYADSLDWLTN